VIGDINWPSFLGGVAVGGLVWGVSAAVGGYLVCMWLNTDRHGNVPWYRP
jgi:hypothetical protein